MDKADYLARKQSRHDVNVMKMPTMMISPRSLLFVRGDHIFIVGCERACIINFATSLRPGPVVLGTA